MRVYVCGVTLQGNGSFTQTTLITHDAEVNGEGRSTERRDFCRASASGTCPRLYSFFENVDNIREWTGLEFAKSQRAVENREKWKKLIAKSSVVPKNDPRGEGIDDDENDDENVVCDKRHPQHK